MIPIQYGYDQFLFLEAAPPCGAREGPAAPPLPPALLPPAHPGLLPELLLRILKKCRICDCKC